MLLVVIGFWLVVIAGGADPDADHGGQGEPLGFLGLGGVPLSVPLSLLVLFAWFASLAGSQLLTLPAWVILVAALAAAWLLARLAVLALRPLLPHGPGPSRADFLGRVCVIRTGRVTSTFGQAEVHASDGSSAIVQVRQAGHDDLRAGTEALLYDADPDGEFFWVIPTDISSKEL